MRHPKYVLLENVDRLLKSPTAQRGRDFAIILSCLYRLGYSVEWHVVNAADYGIPQRRRRVYIYAEHDAPRWIGKPALPCRSRGASLPHRARRTIRSRRKPPVSKDPYKSTKEFGIGDKISRFKEAGVMQNGKVLTRRVKPVYAGPQHTLGEILVPIDQVPEEFFITGDNLKSWEYLKGGKHEKRTASNGHEYIYSEGPVAFPSIRWTNPAVQSSREKADEVPAARSMW